VEPDLLRDAGLLAADPVAGPAVRQVQLPVHQRMPAAGAAQEHTDLAVLDPPAVPEYLSIPRLASGFTKRAD
jgi:hypothetical protein